ncbi:hypothetical protein [Aquibacillus albus]|uniref:Uncharacterized protein n=1 Tax=Aquibacillus albus TaxID=1168171 RepID=A0ABS2MZT9_9BACI|nr:hypothetical protein [Aquibacillus albus]MBM7571308.1 hypothetical protein [Aquibacillus albus]
MNKPKKHEILLWNIALPGFGQILNKKFIKGITFVFMEFIVNVQSNFNLAIKHSFTNNIEQAYDVINYQWLMFYPCLYMFAIWDGYRDAEDAKLGPYSYLPFVFGAFALTIGLMYSNTVMIRIGPVFFPMLCLIPGVFVGWVIKRIFIHVEKSPDQ